MWLMLPTGALSIVTRTNVDEGDEQTLQVRARRPEWLEEFRDRYCPELGEVFHIDGADYQWRAHVKPDDMARAAARAVLAIDYRNFKNATMDPKYGLRTAKARSNLHSAYTKTWNALLDAGDGTSVYDFKSWSGKGGSALTGIEACRRWGHWWPVNSETCKDCGEPNPAYPEMGPSGVFPPGYPKKVVRRRRTRKQQSAKATVTGQKKARRSQPAVPDFEEYAGEQVTGVPASKGSDVIASSGACPGSWTMPVEDSYQLAIPDNGYQETGVCPMCGTRQPLTADGMDVQLHWPAEVSA